MVLALTDRQGYRTLIGVDREAQEVFVDRTRSGPHVHDAFPDRHTAPVSVREGHVRLRVFVDRSIVEVFAQGDESVITDRFFRGGGTLSVSAYTLGGPARLAWKSWRMDKAP